MVGLREGEREGEGEGERDGSRSISETLNVSFDKLKCCVNDTQCLP